MSNRLSNGKFNEVGAMLVSNYIEDFFLAVRLRQFKVARLALRGIDNLKPGAYFTEKHSYWFTRAKNLLLRLRLRKMRFPKPPRPPRIYKRPELRGGKLGLEWKIACLNRDKWKCQVCQIKTNLHIHHIKPYKDFIDKRLDVNNGITLCKLHHKLKHRKK